MEKNEYREMFSKLRTSINEEELFMHQKKSRKPRIAALVLAAALTLALAVGAYAVYRSRVQDLVLRPCPATAI